MQRPLPNHGKYNQNVAEQGQTGDDDEDQGPPTVGVRLFVNVRRRPALTRTHHTGRRDGRGAVHGSIQIQVGPAVVIGRQINECAVIQSIDVIVQIVEHEQVRYPRVILGSKRRGRDGREEGGGGGGGGRGGSTAGVGGRGGGYRRGGVVEPAQLDTAARLLGSREQVVQRALLLVDGVDLGRVPREGEIGRSASRPPIQRQAPRDRAEQRLVARLRPHFN